MSLRTIVDNLARIFDAQDIWTPHDVVLGFATPPPDAASCSLKRTEEGYHVVDGLREAAVIFSAPLAFFVELGNVISGQAGPANVAHFLEQLTIVPQEFMAEAAWFFHDGLGLDLDPAAYQFKGTLAPPLRYPSGENTFRAQRYTTEPVPAYDAAALPELIAADHPEWRAVYDKAWQIAFSNLRQPEPESGFIANFIDTAFNDNSFMWDSCFMTMFGHYGRRVFPFIRTLDNFYAKQHADGYICREINTYDGRDIFTPFDPSSTGPNIMAWTEWQDYQHSGDSDRLRAIFPALVAYHRWWRDWRTWPDGGYFTTGWGSGMDNQTRVPNSKRYHQHYTWADATMQQALNCRVLLQMAAVIERDEFNAELDAEYQRLTDYVNTRMWDEASAFYYDLAPDGSFSPVKSIGAYWGLLAGIVPADRAAHMLAHLDDPALFKRPHRVPSQAADSEGYVDNGEYWRGGIWPPTNYMVLRALTALDAHDLAYNIARNHLENVTRVYQETGTLWENYAPEYAGRGRPAKSDFVGWTGISAINVPLEYVIGVRPGTAADSVLWDIRLTEQHGIRRYPLGQTGTLDLMCAARAEATTPPQLSVTTDIAFTLDVKWESGARTLSLEPGAHDLDLSK